MQALNAAPWFKELLTQHQPPCISIYLPVSRSAAPSNETPAELRNITDEVRQTFSSHDVARAPGNRAALERLDTVLNDISLWEGDREGLAIFVSPTHSHVIELQRPPERTVIVADSFHVKPLIRLLQQSQQFRVLCVSPRRVRMFEGGQFALREITLRNVPLSVDDALATNATGPSTTPQMPGRVDAPTAQPSTAGGSVDTDRFFRHVDQAIWENYSRKDRLPIVVCADVQYLSRFLTMSKNDHIEREGIQLNPEAATPDRLREAAWKILEPRFAKQIQTLKDAYQAAKARRLGSDEIPQVAEAAAIGRVGTLLVDSDVKVPGILHRDSGLLEQAAMSDPRADDVLDDLAEMVLKTDGQVFVVPHDQMPTDHGVAAVYRY
jgi:hypothetical protein